MSVMRGGGIVPEGELVPAEENGVFASSGSRSSVALLILLAVVVVLALQESTLPWALVVVVVSSAIAVGVADVRCRRIPNSFVSATALGGAIVACCAAATGTAAGFAGFVAGGLVAGIPLLVVHLVSPSGIGFGDVKYAFALGACLGVLDWRLGVLTVLLASVIGPLVAIGWKPWRRSIPLGLLLGGVGAALVIAEVVRS